MLGVSIRMKAGTADVARDVTPWILAGVAATLISSADPAAAALAAGVGAAATLAGSPVLVVLSLAAAAVLGPAIFPWAVAAAALVYAAPRRPDVPRLDSDLQRQLMRSRRREEPAAVLVVEADKLPSAGVRELLATLRTTDGVEVTSRGGRSELRAVLDARDLDRTAVERRIRDAVHADATVGWAAFPEDGVTLETLVAAAREMVRQQVVPEAVIDTGAAIGAHRAPSMAEVS